MTFRKSLKDILRGTVSNGFNKLLRNVVLPISLATYIGTSAGCGGSSEAPAPITPPTNAAPTIQAAGTNSGEELDTLKRVYTASDSDGTISSLTISGRPAGAVWQTSPMPASTVSGTLIFRSDYNSSGAHNLTVSATDNDGAVTNKSDTLTITNVSSPLEVVCNRYTGSSSSPNYEGHSFILADGSQNWGNTEQNIASAPRWNPSRPNVIIFSQLTPANFGIDVFEATVNPNKSLSNKTNLTNGGVDNYSFGFSADGSSIVLVSTRDLNNEIYKMTSTGTNQTRLTNDFFSQINPCIAPNGKIYYQTNETGNSEIFSINQDGSGKVNETNNSAWDGDPFVDSQGTLWFASSRAGRSQIFSKTSSGTITQHTNVSDYAAQPRRSPNLKRMVFTRYDAADTYTEVWLKDANATFTNTDSERLIAGQDSNKYWDIDIH